MAWDIRQKSFCTKLVQETVNKFGRLDILVNNAAFQQIYRELADISEEESTEPIARMSTGPFSLRKQLSP